jgi:hypothetical protein
MKKTYFLISLVLLASCFAKPKPEIPVFNLMLPDSVTIFNTQNIPEGKPSLLVWFSPDCEHCQRETAELLRSMGSLKKVNFYFLTIEPIERIRLFNDSFKLYRYPNITIGMDYKFFFPAHYQNKGVPYSMLFDRDKVLRAAFKGEVPVSKVIKAVAELD